MFTRKSVTIVQGDPARKQLSFPRRFADLVTRIYEVKDITQVKDVKSRESGRSKQTKK